MSLKANFLNQTRNVQGMLGQVNAVEISVTTKEYWVCKARTKQKLMKFVNQEATSLHPSGYSILFVVNIQQTYFQHFIIMDSHLFIF